MVARECMLAVFFLQPSQYTVSGHIQMAFRWQDDSGQLLYTFWECVSVLYLLSHMLRPYLPSFTDLILQPLVESSAGSHSPGALFCWKALTSWVLPARFNPSTSTRLVIPPCNSKVYVEMLPRPYNGDGRVASWRLTVLCP